MSAQGKGSVSDPSKLIDTTSRDAGAVCCSVLQCCAVWCSVVQRVAVRCFNVLQYVVVDQVDNTLRDASALCCSALQCDVV